MVARPAQFDGLRRPGGSVRKPGFKNFSPGKIAWCAVAARARRSRRRSDGRLSGGPAGSTPGRVAKPAAWLARHEAGANRVARVDWFRRGEGPPSHRAVSRVDVGPMGPATASFRQRTRRGAGASDGAGRSPTRRARLWPVTNTTRSANGPVRACHVASDGYGWVRDLPAKKRSRPSAPQVSDFAVVFLVLPALPLSCTLCRRSGCLARRLSPCRSGPS